jgi:Fic family protein
MAYNPTTPYDELPLLPPEVDVNSKAVLMQCIKSSRALGELKGAGAMIPDQSILINAIPLQEAKLSSEIENIVTTQDDLYYGNIGGKPINDPKIKEVLQYRTALKYGYEAIKKQNINLGIIQEICSKLLEDKIEFRQTDSTVRIMRRSPRKVVYTPPSGGPVVQEKLDNLVMFLNYNSHLDPLIRLAIAHYQFEAIHPFNDGNGRTGRIINILFLIQSHLIDIPVLYLSRYIIKKKPDYYRLLQGVTEQNQWEDWILYLLTGVEETALWTTSRINAIYTLLDETIQKCRESLPKIYSKELIELIFKQPYCKIGFLVESGIAERQTASDYLQALERIGILVSEKRGREMVYKHPALIKILAA